MAYQEETDKMKHRDMRVGTSTEVPSEEILQHYRIILSKNIITYSRILTIATQCLSFLPFVCSKVNTISLHHAFYVQPCHIHTVCAENLKKYYNADVTFECVSYMI